MREIPEIPTGFLKDQKDLWEKIWAGNQHINAQRDYLIVQLLCETWLEYRSFLKLSKKDKIHRNANGTVQLHPAVSHSSNLRKEILGYVKVLGLSPLDAASLALGDPIKEARSAELQARPDRSQILAEAEED